MRDQLQPVPETGHGLGGDLLDVVHVDDRFDDLLTEVLVRGLVQVLRGHHLRVVVRSELVHQSMVLLAHDLLYMDAADLVLDRLPVPNERPFVQLRYQRIQAEGTAWR